jgi:hypothetical protein
MRDQGMKKDAEKGTRGGLRVSLFRRILVAFHPSSFIPHPSSLILFGSAARIS